MKNRVCMVSVEQLGTIIKSSPTDNMTLGTNLFEGGMIEVLKDVAVWQMENIRYEVGDSTHTIGAVADADAAYEALENTLSAKQKVLLSNLDGARAYQTAMETADHFMSGFIHGYAFLKHITTFNTLSSNEKSPL